MNDNANQHSSAVNTPAVGSTPSASDYSDISDTGAAEVLQYNLDTSGDRVKVRGVVRNNSGELLSPVAITVVLLDSNGQEVGSKEAYPGNTPEFAMAPGQKA